MPERRPDPDRPPVSDRRDRDAIIAGIASRQHGVVSRQQLLADGLTRRMIDYRVEKGRLRVLFRGVYAVGPVRSPYESEMAAVLGAGDGAVVSHATAAALHDLLPVASRATVSITVVGRRPLLGPRVRVHRVRALDASETTVLHGIPAVTAARTLLDLSVTAGVRDFERVVARAYRSGAVDDDALSIVLDRHPRRPGAPRLRAMLARRSEPALTRSELEAQFLDLIRRARLRPVRTNALVGGLEVDFVWDKERVIVEVDGFAFHSSREAFERDRRRDQILIGAGFRVLRVTWRQVVNEPEAVLAAVVRALASGSAGR